MGIQTLPAVTSKTRRVVTLTSGTSWTVPAGCLYVNATLLGAGGGSHGAQGTPPNPSNGADAVPITTTVTTTPGASVSYAIGAGGIAGTNGGYDGGGQGGTTTFTGAVSSIGGNPSVSNNYVSPDVSGYGKGALGIVAVNINTTAGQVGGQGKIELEYWV